MRPSACNARRMRRSIASSSTTVSIRPILHLSCASRPYGARTCNKPAARRIYSSEHTDRTGDSMQFTPWDNPMGTDGFEFVEYAAPDPLALGKLFETMGFRAIAKHRTKNVTLYRQ